MAARRLAGDQLAEAMRTARIGKQLGPDERARSGGTDPQSVAEFLAYDIPFRTEPAITVVFPPEAQPDDD